VSAVLVIAGSDSSGGAGLVRDLLTLAHFGTAATCALTAVTAQTHGRLVTVHALPAELVRAQIETAFASAAIGAVKIGMLANADIVRAVSASLAPRAGVPVVLDPVLAASSGGALLDAPGRAALCASLLPQVTLLTPNIPEAATLLRSAAARDEDEMLRQARALVTLGPQAVLIKGGHATGSEAVDLLLGQGGAVQRMAGPRLANSRRGTGCALAAGIAAGLAAGRELGDACRHARQHVLELLQGPA
jgi:hydroxymethylpyrimidine/phosphomethylpyrimidine kinase